MDGFQQKKLQVTTTKGVPTWETNNQFREGDSVSLRQRFETFCLTEIKVDLVFFEEAIEAAGFKAEIQSSRRPQRLVDVNQ